MLALFVFHNQTTHKILNALSFSKYFKHVDLYTFDGKEWIGFRFGTGGMIYTFTGYTEVRDLIDSAQLVESNEALIAVDIENGCKFPWRPLTIPMCNEFARYIAKVDIGFTWNPRNLYNKLLKYDQETNFEVFYLWRRDHGRK